MTAPARFERIVARVLLTGVVAATTFILVGTALTFLHHPEYRTSTDALRTLLAPDALHTSGALLGSLSTLRGQGFVLAGIVLLIATPIVRVAVTATLLLRSGERVLALFGVGVLALLTVSFVVGHAH